MAIDSISDTESSFFITWNDCVAEQTSWFDHIISYDPYQQSKEAFLSIFQGIFGDDAWNWSDHLILDVSRKHKAERKQESFWEENKKAIIIVSIVVVVVATVVTITVCTGGAGSSATSAAVAIGAEAINELLDQKEEIKPRSTTTNQSPSNMQQIGHQPIEQPVIPAPIFPLVLENTAIPPTDLSLPIIIHPDSFALGMIDASLSLPAFDHSIPQIHPQNFSDLIYLDHGFIQDGQYHPYHLPNPTGMFQAPNHAYPFNPRAPFFNQIQEHRPPNAPTGSHHISPPRSYPSSSHNPFTVIGEQLNYPEVSMDDPLLQDGPRCSRVFVIEGVKYKASRIGFINGMNTTLEEAQKHAEYLQRISNGTEIECVYNQTHGIIADSAEIFLLNYNGASPNTARLLIENWTRFVEENRDDPDAQYLQIGHSQGMIDIYNALAQAPPEVRERVRVLGIAGGRAVPPEFCAKAENYASKNDLVPIGGKAMEIIQKTNRLLTGDLLVFQKETNAEIIFLDPHPDAEGLDHDFESPTYKEIIKTRIQDYINNK